MPARPLIEIKKDRISRLSISILFPAQSQTTFVIASGTNSNQVQAIVDNVEEQLGRAGFEAKQIEGNRNSSWILMDYGDVIVHVFDEENRLFYDLERIWRDGKVLEMDEFLEK